MATLLEKSEKRDPDRSFTNKYLSFGEKIIKIGTVNPETTGLQTIIENERN